MPHISFKIKAESNSTFGTNGLSDNFLAICSHNQSDEDLAMSIKYRGVPFRIALTNC